MTNAQIKKILDLHCVQHYEHGGSVYALEVYTTRTGGKVTTHANYIDITAWTRPRLLSWLGY